MEQEISIDFLIEALKKDGLRITSYTANLKGKDARLALVKYLQELKSIRCT
jgi:hypothetical protein